MIVCNKTVTQHSVGGFTGIDNSWPVIAKQSEDPNRILGELTATENLERVCRMLPRFEASGMESRL
jgi:hypothetical protein